jgi:Fe-S-cluster containining protein
MALRTKPADVKACRACGAKCCRYVAVEIDEPETKEDFQDIRWYLCHRDVWVFIDHDDTWYLQFNASCEFLGKNSACEIYDSRPTICRSHDPADCEDNDEDGCQKFMLKTIDDLDSYLKLRGRRMRWRK